MVHIPHPPRCTLSTKGWICCRSHNDNTTSLQLYEASWGALRRHRAYTAWWCKIYPRAYNMCMQQDYACKALLHSQHCYFVVGNMSYAT
jgi:hypothetical protein